MLVRLVFLLPAVGALLRVLGFKRTRDLLERFAPPPALMRLDETFPSESANRIARQFFSSTRGSIQVYGKTVKNNDAVLDGIDVVTARLWSPSDNMRRLFFAPHLQKAREKRSIIQCMRLYKWKQRNVSSSTVYDIVAEKGVYDHGPDALRYYCWRRYLTQRFDSATAASIAERQENYAMGRAA